MLFQTPEFFFLLLLSSLLYWFFPQQRLLILGVASGIFYGWAGTGYLILFFAMSLLTYGCSVMLKASGNKGWLWLGVSLNVINLMFFKYAVFLLREITGWTGIVLVPPGSIMGQLVLPVGISFYTFQLIAYIVDVDRQEISPTGFLRFWVFISFFAQLVAGPIMRGRDFLPQINEIRKVNIDYRLIKWGIFFIVLGLVKKVVIADQISSLVDWYFARPRWIFGFQAWVGAYLFGFQIYLDFSGYSDIALGLGKIFGLKMTPNFHTPYLSENPSEFWRRWHITLSSWVRDYIYIPLGGSRHGQGRKNMNLLLSMTICGFWHGAAWTFLLWGIFHGLILVFYHQLKRIVIFPALSGRVRSVLSVFMTYQLITIGWVFFRAENISQAFIYISHMFSGFQLNQLLSNKKAFLLVAFLLLLHLAEEWFFKDSNRWSKEWGRVPALARGLIYFLIIGLIIISFPNGQQQFIYFRF